MELLTKCVLAAFTSFFLLNFASTEKSEAGEKPSQNEKWKKKDVRDYTDVDVEHLYDQWEEAEDEPLEDDELPEWKRPKPKIDLSKLNPNDPEGMLKMSKQGQTLMMFATVSGNPTEKETETITQIWQSSLFNAHFDVQRYVVGSNRVLFVLKDGSKAWEVKDFLTTQDRCEAVTIEGKDYPGRGAQSSKVKDSKKVTEKSSKKSKKDEKSSQKVKSKSATSKGHNKSKKTEKTREDL